MEPNRWLKGSPKATRPVFTLGLQGELQRASTRIPAAKRKRRGAIKAPVASLPNPTGGSGRRRFEVRFRSACRNADVAGFARKLQREGSATPVRQARLSSRT